MRCSRLCYALFCCPVCRFAFHSAYFRCRPRLRAAAFLLNRGWGLGEEEDHHNGGRKARGSGQNRDAGPKPLSGGSAHQPDKRRANRSCQQGDPQPLPQPRKLIKPAHINRPPLSAQPASILQGHGHPDGRGRGQNSGSVHPDWGPDWAAASFFRIAPGPPWAFYPGTYRRR